MDPVNGLTYTIGGVDIARMPHDVYEDLDDSIGRVSDIMSYASDLQGGLRRSEGGGRWPARRNPV